MLTEILVVKNTEDLLSWCFCSARLVTTKLSVLTKHIQLNEAELENIRQDLLFLSPVLSIMINYQLSDFCFF